MFRHVSNVAAVTVWAGRPVTCLVERDPLGAAALVEIVENVPVVGDERRQGRSHADRDSGADGLYGLGPGPGAEEQPQQQDRTPRRSHVSHTHVPCLSTDTRGQPSSYTVKGSNTS